MKLSDLTPIGTDCWDRPAFKNAATGQFYCLVDLYGTLEDVAAGRRQLYTKGDDPDGEPGFPMRIEPEATPAAVEAVKPRTIDLDLTTVDGNAFMLMAAFRYQARREDWSREEIEAVLSDARGGDYDHLVGTLAQHCEPRGS